MSRLPLAFLCFFALLLPFEASQHARSWGGMEWTTVEGALLLPLLGWGLALYLKGERPQPQLALASPWGAALLWLAVAAMSAALASGAALHSARFVLRLASGVALAAATARLVDGPRALRRLLTCLLFGALASVALAALELPEWPATTPLFAPFKASSSLVGGVLRISGPFPFATVAAAFWEMCFPLALGLAAWARGGQRAVGWVAALLLPPATFLTLTRSSGALLLALLAAAWLLGWHRAWRPLRAPATGALLSSALAIALLFQWQPAFRARLQSEGEAGWFDTRWQVPPALASSAPHLTVPIEVRNVGRMPWHASGPRPFRVEARWLDRDGQPLALPPQRLPLPHPVAPGARLRLAFPLALPLPAGHYRVSWDIAQEGTFALRHQGAVAGQSRVWRLGGAWRATDAAARPPSGALPPHTVPRRDLWRAAVQLWRASPLLGVGPDRFRELYGATLGLARWDTRLTANSVPLELLATQGILGLMAWGGWMVVALRHGFRAWHAAAKRPWLAVVGSALALWTLHGLVDFFLNAAPVAFLWWLLLGCWLSAPRWVAQEGSGAPARSAP